MIQEARSDTQPSPCAATGGATFPHPHRSLSCARFLPGALVTSTPPPPPPYGGRPHKPGQGAAYPPQSPNGGHPQQPQPSPSPQSPAPHGGYPYGPPSPK